MTRPLVIAPVGDRVEVVASTLDGTAITVSLPLPDAERAAGQIAVAILAARLAARGGADLDRR